MTLSQNDLLKKTGTTYEPVPGVIVQATASASETRMVRGLVASAGSITAGSGFTVAKGAGGVYTITFSTAFSATPVIFLTAGSFVIPHLASPAAGSFQALFTSAGGVGTDTDFHFLAVEIA